MLISKMERLFDSYQLCFQSSLRISRALGVGGNRNVIRRGILILGSFELSFNLFHRGFWRYFSMLIKNLARDGLSLVYNSRSLEDRDEQHRDNFMDVYLTLYLKYTRS